MITPIAAKIIPRKPLDRGEPETYTLSHDPAQAAAWAADPLVHSYSTPRWAVEYLSAAKEAKALLAKLSLPVRVVMQFRVACLSGVRVGVQVQGAVGMAMQVDVDALAEQAEEDIHPQDHQHDTHQQLQYLCGSFWNGTVQQQNHRAKQKQGESMPDSPCGSLPERIGDGLAAGCQRGHRGDVVALQGVPHPDHKAEGEQTEIHAAGSFASAGREVRPGSSSSRSGRRRRESSRSSGAAQRTAGMSVISSVLRIRRPMALV